MQRTTLLVAALAGVIPGLAFDKSSDPEFTPPRPSQPIPEYGDCHASGAMRPGRDRQAKVTLTIAKDGAIESISLPEDSPGWMTELADCTLRRIQFAPATRKGKSVESDLYLTMDFAPGDGTDSGTIRILELGSMVTPPRILNRYGIPSRCIPPAARANEAGVSRFVVQLTVMPDGSVTGLRLPVGGPSWIEASARCFVESTQFFPGTRDGVPIEAEATLPISLFGSDNPGPSEQLVVPRVQSDFGELEAAYRACYPPDQAAMVSVFFSFTVETDGRVTDPTVVRSSGDPRLDEAGTCVLKLLRFTPLLQGKRTLKSTITWELPLRPPR